MSKPEPTEPQNTSHEVGCLDLAAEFVSPQSCVQATADETLEVDQLLREPMKTCGTDHPPSDTRPRRYLRANDFIGRSAIDCQDPIDYEFADLSS